MVKPNKIRYWTVVRSYGHSLFVLVPAMIKNFMKLEKRDNITVVYDTKRKVIEIRKVRK